MRSCARTHTLAHTHSYCSSSRASTECTKFTTFKTYMHTFLQSALSLLLNFFYPLISYFHEILLLSSFLKIMTHLHRVPEFYLNFLSCSLYQGSDSSLCGRDCCYIVVFQYGSIVLFNVPDNKIDGYLNLVKTHASGILPEMRKDGKICLA